MDSSIEFKKINDLIATFSPEILDKFEECFLDFATEKVNVEMPYKKFGSVKHDNFQDLLKSIVTIKKKDTDPTDKLSLIKTLSFSYTNLANCSAPTAGITRTWAKP